MIKVNLSNKEWDVVNAIISASVVTGDIVSSCKDIASGLMIKFMDEYPTTLSLDEIVVILTELTDLLATGMRMVCKGMINESDFEFFQIVCGVEAQLRKDVKVYEIAKEIEKG